MLAPKIIFDKCTLQGIGTLKIPALLRHLDLLLPPILLREIATEFSKDDKIPEKIEGMARSLAQKALSSRVDVMPDIDILIYNELLYQPLKLCSKQIPQGHGIWLRSKDGSKGMVFDEAPEMAILRRWAYEDFSENDIKNSFFIRQNHEQMVRNYPPKKKGDNSPKTLQEVVAWIDSDHLTKINQELIISTVAGYLPEAEAKNAIERWDLEKRPDLLTYAPFCYYFYRLTAIYILAAQSQVLRTNKDAKPHLDIHYLYYLPFCDVFASDDTDVQNIATLLKRTDQIVTNKEELIKEIGELTTFEKSKLPRNAISRRPGKDCPATIIQKAWAGFTNQESQEETSFSNNRDSSLDSEAFAQFKMTQSSIIFETNRSLNPIYTEEFNKLSLTQKNLIVYDLLTEKFDTTSIPSKISKFFSLYADLWRPDSDLNVLFQGCKDSISKPLWMFDGNDFSWLEYQFMLPYFNQILTIDPVPNPWNFKHGFNPISNPNGYVCLFEEMHMFYILISEALYSRQMLILPRFEELEPKLAWNFAQIQQERQKNWVATDEEKKEIESRACRFQKRIQQLQLDPTLNFQAMGIGIPSIETAILLSGLSGSIPITSSSIRRNEFIKSVNQKDKCKVLVEIEDIFQNHWFKFLPQYPPFFMGKLKETGFLLEFREFFISLLTQIKRNTILDKKWVSELRVQLKKLDQEWDDLILSETFDENSPVYKGKLAIYFGEAGPELNAVNRVLRESYGNLFQESGRTIFMTISDITKFEDDSRISNEK